MLASYMKEEIYSSTLPFIYQLHKLETMALHTRSDWEILLNAEKEISSLDEIIRNINSELAAGDEQDNIRKPEEVEKLKEIKEELKVYTGIILYL